MIATLILPELIGSTILDVFWSIFIFLVLVLILPAIYFLPTIVAFKRRVPNRGSVGVINLFLGWTLIGWVVALAMAARTVPPD